ncbi:MAG: hypothetical protein WBM54_05125 [Woeseia sp.]
MNSSKLKVSVLLALGTFGLAACGSNNADSIPVFETPPTPPAPPVPPQSYTLFVKDQFANTADNTDPVEINDVDFNFDNAENPRAFDDLLRNN